MLEQTVTLNELDLYRIEFGLSLAIQDFNERGMAKPERNHEFTRDKILTQWKVKDATNS